MDHRNIRGKILYIGGDDQERGREWFSMTFHEDGQRTLRAHCEIDDTEVLRETTYTMDENWQPLDCFNRLHVERKFLGTGWVRAYGHEAIKVTSPAELEPALEKAFGMKDKLVFLDIYVDPAEHVYPMVPAGKSNSEMLRRAMTAEE